MKKILFTIGICVLLLAMTSIHALPLPLQKGLGIRETPQKTLVQDTPPDWAAGNFSGEWGITLFGIPAAPLGWIEGYFSDTPGWGRLEGDYATFNETNATSKLSGFMIWIFFLGGVQDIETANGTWVSGIGVANETHFYWRLNAIIGPSFFIHCEYSKFEE